MTSLGCNLCTCAYNENHCCCKGDINVGDKEAVTPSGTCCDSFKTGSEVNSSCDCEPKKSIAISCEAYNCTYNENKACTADHVDISGSSADTSRETECSSFKSKID